MAVDRVKRRLLASRGRGGGRRGRGREGDDALLISILAGYPDSREAPLAEIGQQGIAVVRRRRGAAFAVERRRAIGVSGRD